MKERPPPDVDAEFRVVHGPWPRWFAQLGLVKLALTAAGVVLACIVVTLGIVWVLGRVPA